MSIKKTILKPLIKPLVIIFIMILGLSFAVYWHFTSFQRSLSEIEFPEFEMSEVNPDLLLGKTDKQEWIDPAGKLKMEFPGHWLEIEGKFLEGLLTSTEEGEVLLFAYRFDFKSLGSMVFLAVQKLIPDESLKKTVEKTKKEAEERGAKIINLKIEENWAEFEIESRAASGDIFHSKEKLFLAGEDLYSISVIAPKKNWSQIEKEANEIFESVETVSEENLPEQK